MIVGCIVYPAGWDHPQVKQVCGQGTDKYNRDQCEIRWAYILAIIGIFLTLALAILGFILGVQHKKRVQEPDNYSTLQNNCKKCCIPQNF